MMENRVSNSKANATYQNSSKVKEVAYRIFAAVASTEVEPLTKQEQVEEVGTLETLYLVIK